jgi:hypothetical protein
MRKDLSASQLQFGKSTSDETCHDAGMVHHFLELSRCEDSLFQLEIGETSGARTFPARGSSRLGLNHPNICTIYEIGPRKSAVHRDGLF